MGGGCVSTWTASETVTRELSPMESGNSQGPQRPRPGATLFGSPSPPPRGEVGEGKKAHGTGWTLVKEKGGRGVSEELPQTWGSSKKALARPLGSPYRDGPVRRPGRPGPAPVPCSLRQGGGLVSA